MTKKVGIVLINCLLIFWAETSFNFGQKKVTELKEKIITIKIDDKPLGNILYYLIVKYDVAIGFEESTLDINHDDYEFITNLPNFIPNRPVITSGDPSSTEHRFTINVENGKLEDVLNIVVGQLKNYKWEVNDDIVNIFPIKGRNEKYKKLLELNIEQFTLEKNKPIFLIRNRLLALPEVVDFLQNQKTYSSLNRGDFDFTSRKLPVELNFSNLTFKQLLNKITKVKRGGWILKESDLYRTKDKKFIDIEI